MLSNLTKELSSIEAFTNLMTCLWCQGYLSESYSFSYGINSESTVKSGVNFTTMRHMGIINYGANHFRRGQHASRRLNNDVLFSTFCHNGNCFFLLSFASCFQTDVYLVQENILKATKFRKLNIHCCRFAPLLMQQGATVKHLPHGKAFMSSTNQVSLSKTNV